MRRRLAMALAIALFAGVARGEPPPADVRQALSSGVVVNWTTLRLEVTERATGRGVSSSRKAVEQQVRSLVGPGILSGARAVEVTPELGYADLEQDASLGAAVRSRTERWTVTEARYLASGAVELVGELSLQELLKPWTLSVARQAPDVGAVQPPYTGLVVDARGTGADLAFAPRLLSDDGEVLYDGFLWEEEAIDRAPVAYVADPAHPLVAERAGAEPMRVKAASASGSRLTLTHEDAVAFETVMQRARVLGEGRVVVVVDAP